MEKDFETANDDFPIAIGIGARIYDGRLGRWLSLDVVSNSNQSNYASFKCSPICVVDPTGKTDYYNESGDWIGTDGNSNSIKQIVTDKTIIKEIIKTSNKGQEYTKELPNGTFHQLPNKNVLAAIVATFNASQIDHKDEKDKIIKEGGFYETGTSFDKDGVQTPIVEGGQVSVLDDAAHVTLSESGSVSIHTHPTGYFAIPLTGQFKSYDAERSPGEANDQGFFKGYDLNIIVGYDAPYSEREEPLAGGGSKKVPTERNLIVNFYDKVNKLFSITYSALEKISKGNDDSKTKKKYDKAKQKAASRNSTNGG